MLAAAWISAAATGLLAVLAGFTALYARNAGCDSLSWPHCDGLKWLHVDDASMAL
jgi:hypothetical protein